MSALLKLLAPLLATLPNSLKNHVNALELLRAVAAGVFSGGGLLGILTAVQAAASVEFPNATDASLATFAISVLLAVLAQMKQGKPVPTA